MGSSDDFDVVVICSGNRFRSPIAEAVLRREAEGLPVRVRSFGSMGPALRARALRGDRARAGLRPRPDVSPEIADPIGGPAAGYRKIADEVYRLTTRLGERLFG